MQKITFRKVVSVLSILSAMAISLAGFGQISSAEEEPPMDANKLISQAQEAYQKVNDYTATFHKQERVGKRLMPKETIFMKFRKPFSVYMKWIKAPHKGRQVMYVQGKNNGNLKAKEGGLLGVMTVNLDPTGSMALRGNRHPLTKAGIGKTLDLLGDNFKKATKVGGLEVRSLGDERIYGRDTIKVEAKLPKGKGLYCGRAVLNVDKKNQLPIKVSIYDEDDNLVEDYGYENLKLNVGLTDEDFSDQNSEYNF